MKYIILVPDGAADEPNAQLQGKTPLEAASTPNMDFLAQQGVSALVQTIPDGFPPGSDIGNLALMGYEPAKHFSGRAPLEAANIGIMLKDDEVAFRCNLVHVEKGVMVDYSAGHIATEEAKILIEDLARNIDWPDVRFFPGKSYRHLMVVKTIGVSKMMAIKTTPPHDIIGKEIAAYLPQGPQCEVLLALMEKAKKFLPAHQLNTVKTSLNETTANMIWLWGQGCKPNIPSFKSRYGLTGSVISAVDLVNGIGRLAGLNVISVPGANGYYDTNYKGKAEYALESLKTHDFVYVHVEAPDEAGHNGDLAAKIKSIEDFDREIVGTILNHFGQGADVRILISPDHPTPIVKRTHTRTPVPFVMAGSGITSNGAGSYNEAEAGRLGIKFTSGLEMIQQFLKKG